MSKSKSKGITASEMGKKGGAAKVAKGFSKMDPERRRELAKIAGKASGAARRKDK
jgi:general stress protein YciG